MQLVIYLVCYSLGDSVVQWLVSLLAAQEVVSSTLASALRLPSEA